MNNRKPGRSIPEWNTRFTRRRYRPAHGSHFTLDDDEHLDVYVSPHTHIITRGRRQSSTASPRPAYRNW